MKIVPILFFLAITLILLGCKKDSRPELPEISVINIGQESDWDYWVVGKNDYYYIKAENSLPKSVLFHSSEADKDYSIFFTEDGMPDKVVVDDYIFIFRNFNGRRVDLGIINPTGDIEILRELETDFDWSNITLKNANSIEEWIDVIRWTGRVVAGVPCALSIATAVSTSGITTPLALWSCGNYILKLSGDLAKHEGNIHNGFTDFVDTYGDALLIANCSGGDAKACIFSSSARGYSELADYLEQIETTRAEDVQTTEAALDFGYGDVQITLVWNNEADLDLHVFDPNDEEIWWKYPSSYSGGVLDVDDIDGYGPENVYWSKRGAPTGNYEVYIHYYVWDDQPWRPYTSNYTVLINAFGRIKKFSGSIVLGKTIHIQDFDENGLKSANIRGQFKISAAKKIK